MKTQKEIENCLASELSNMIDEFKLDRLYEELIVDYFITFLLDAEVNPDIIINVLQRKEFGQIGKDAARSIKVELGY